MNDSNAHSGRLPDCPRCGYELRGLIVPENSRDAEGRCPECALVFVWSILLDPLLVAPKWFVETQFGSVFMNSIRTTIRSVFPWYFWRSVHMGLWRRNGRALASAVIGLLWLWCVLAALGFVTAIVFDTFANPYMGSAPGTYLSNVLADPVTAFLEAVMPESVGLWGSPWQLATFVAYATVPVAMLLAPDTLKRAKVLPGHIVRIVIYSIAPMLLVCALPYAFRCIWWMIDVGVLGNSYSVSAADFVADYGHWLRPGLAFAAILLTWGFALSRYLKLPRPWLIAALIGIVSVLFGVLVTIFFTDSEILFGGI